MNHPAVAAILLDGGILHTFESEADARAFLAAHERIGDVALHGVMGVAEHHPKAVAEHRPKVVVESVPRRLIAGSHLLPCPDCGSNQVVACYSDDRPTRIDHYLCFSCGNAWAAGEAPEGGGSHP